MARARAEPQGRDPRWTADELAVVAAERYEDLAWIEPFVDAAAERAAAPGRSRARQPGRATAERHGAPAREARPSSGPSHGKAAGQCFPQ
jgi:hypothetical protein